MLDRLAVLMGGRVAEEIFVGDVSSGAQMDITQATRLVRSMVCEWGMTDELGTVALDERAEGGQYLGGQGLHEKNYSEATAEVIDKQVRGLLDDALKYARKVVEEHRAQVELMTQMLMEFESLDREDVLEIMANTFDADKKKKRLKITEDLQRKTPPPPPEQVPDSTSSHLSETPTPQQI